MKLEEYRELNLEVCRIQSLLEDVLTENEAFHATEMYNKMLDKIGGLLGISKEEQSEIYQHSLDLMEHERTIYKDFLEATDGDRLASKALSGV